MTSRVFVVYCVVASGVFVVCCDHWSVCSVVCCDHHCDITPPCSHGDMLYLEAVMSPVSPSSNMTAAAAANVTLDEVDNILMDKDGKIYRKMNPQLLVTMLLLLYC